MSSNPLRKKAAALVTAIVTLIVSMCMIYEPEYEIMALTEGENTDALYVEQNSYSNYYDAHINDKKPDKEILIRGVDYSLAENGEFSKGKYGDERDQIKSDVLIWNSAEGNIVYDVDIPESGLYNIAISYCPLASFTTSIEMSVLIDGKSPYDTASRISLNKAWINKNEITENSQGNQIRPSQIQCSMWMETPINDTDGLFNQPLYFYFQKGKHKLSFDASKAYIAIEWIKIYNQKDPLPYADTAPDINEINSTPSTLLRIEGEAAAYKSDSVLYPTSDKSSYLASPSDPGKIVYNTIGDDNWKKSFQTITWIIPEKEIKSDGWYKLGIKSRQQKMRGFYSNRRIYIDNKVTCEEMNQVKFYYDTDWNVVSPSDDEGNSIYVYLTAGQDHKITMEAIPGEIGDSMRRLNSIVSDINEYYRRILMITGPAPDKFTDYNVDRSIPELVDDFSEISKELKDIKDNIESLSGEKGSEAAGIERMYVILDKCIEKPSKIPKYLKQIKDNVSAISSWMRDYKDQPLEVDYIEIASSDREFTSTDEKFIKSAAFSAKAFLTSFFQDYSMISEETDDDVLDVWINLGRDQALAIKELVESDFTPEYNIPVNLNIVQGGVVEAALAGKGPDVALFLGGEFPVNLAARGLTEDLYQFEGIEDVLSNCQKNAHVMYEYNGGLYGLPLQQSFPVMFYRKDILSEIGCTDIPETWKGLIDTLPALQRNYMGAGLVLPTSNISPSTEAGHTFALLMLQSGLNYYNYDMTSTTFDNIKAVQAFETWTDFYSKYKFEQTYDAFSRFRDGTYPIVIQNYTFYNKLKAAAPEINGLWDFTMVPGTVRDDGTVSHAANSSGTGAVIFNKVKNKDDAWQFIKWFSSTEIQIGYGNLIEGLLGTMGRYDPANVQALKQLSWSPSEMDKILGQWNELKEIPVMPASYAVTRNIMTAFRTAVNKHENPRDTIMWLNRDINAEITRKRENLGLD